MFQVGLSHTDVQYSVAKTFIETEHGINSDTSSRYRAIYDMVGAVPDPSPLALCCVLERRDV